MNKKEDKILVFQLFNEDDKMLKCNKKKTELPSFYFGSVFSKERAYIPPGNCEEEHEGAEMKPETDRRLSRNSLNEG